MIKFIKKFLANRLERKKNKALSLIKNAKANKDERIDAINFVKNLKDKKFTSSTLLERFKYSLDHGINDAREKDLALEGILACEKEAIEPIKIYIKNNLNIAWPIKILKKLLNSQQIFDILIDNLNFEDVSLDQSKVNKNYDILCYLRDFDIGDFYKKLSKFLDDHDERIRFAAVEILIEQKNNKDIPILLENFLSDDSSENTRIKQILIDAFLENKWKISNVNKFKDRYINSDIYINNKSFLERI